MKAKIQLTGELLVAELDNGVCLSHADAVTLADLLWEHHVTPSEVSVIDWHHDVAHAPLSGQKVALFHRLRLHEQSND